MARISELHQKWMDEPKYQKAHADLEDEFALAKAVIAARNRSVLAQAELPKRSERRSQ